MEQPKIIIKNADIQKLNYMDKYEIGIIENHIGVPLSVASLWWTESGELDHITIYYGTDVIMLFANHIEYEFLEGGE